MRYSIRSEYMRYDVRSIYDKTTTVKEKLELVNV